MQDIFDRILSAFAADEVLVESVNTITVQLAGRQPFTITVARVGATDTPLISLNDATVEGGVSIGNTAQGSIITIHR